MVGRSLTSRLVLVIAGVTATSSAVVTAALSWQLYSVINSPASERVVSFGDIAASSSLFALTAIGVGTLVGWQLGRLLTRPVLRMANAMERMADGDLSVKTPPSHPSSEIGQMARAFERFRSVAHELITSEAGRQAAEKAAADRSEFLAVISHEIRTPMNGVIGMAEALQYTNLDDDQRKLLDILRGSGETLLQLLNDVIDFAKIEAGKFEIDAAAFDPSKSVETAAGLFSAEAHNKGLDFRFTGPEEDWSLVGDSARVRQVVQNLVSNAVKFTKAGAVEVSAGVAEVDSIGQLTVIVRDTGIGMTRAVQDRLFEKFVQGDPSSTREHGGTGLGLAISRELARMMGGDVVASSEFGVGSTFTFTLPLPLAAGAYRQSKPSEVASKVLDTLRILVAEDNAMNRTVIKMILEPLGADVTFAVDGGAAVESWRALRPDIVLMDLQMPVLDGIAATREIRRLEAAEGIGRTPIVAVTANAQMSDVERSLVAGMCGHVAKPISPELLFAAMTDAIERNSKSATSGGAGRSEQTALRRTG